MINRLWSHDCYFIIHQICGPCFLSFIPLTVHREYKWKILQIQCGKTSRIDLSPYSLVTVFPKCLKWLSYFISICLSFDLCLIFIVIAYETQFSIRNKHIKIQYEKSKKEWICGSLPHPSVSYLRLHFPRLLHLFTFQPWEMFMG